MGEPAREEALDEVAPAWGLSGRAARVYALLASCPGTTMSTADMATALGCSQRTVFRALNDLREARQLWQVLRFDGTHRAMLAPRRWVRPIEDQPISRCHTPMTPLAELKYLWDPVDSLGGAEEAAATRAHAREKDAAAFSPFEPIETAEPENTQTAEAGEGERLRAVRPPEPSAGAEAPLFQATGRDAVPVAAATAAGASPIGESCPVICSASAPPVRPGATLALSDKHRAALLKLPGGRGAMRVLERAGLSPGQQAIVVERVLRYDRHKGVADAARFIHGPIRDVRELEHDEAEVSEAERHDDNWDASDQRVSQAVAAQRIPIFVSPPPKPVPKRTPLEERRDALEGTLALPAGFVSNERRAELEVELREVEAKIAGGEAA